MPKIAVFPSDNAAKAFVTSRSLPGLSMTLLNDLDAETKRGYESGR